MRALEAATLGEAFEITAAQRPDDVALRTVDGTASITWAEYRARATAIAGGLAARGIGRGDTVALMLVQRPEFNLVDTAVLRLGATPFSIYNTSSTEQVAYLVENSRARLIVTEQRFLDRVLAAAPDSDVVLVDGDDTRTTTLGELERGEDGPASPAARPEDLATLIYTSGTTGPPKGVELTHANVLAQWRGIAAVAPMEPGGIVLGYLPSAHIADRLTSHWLSYFLGATVVTCPDPAGALAALPVVRPTFWMAVPRIWEKTMAAIVARGSVAPGAEAAVRAQLGLDRATQIFSGAAPISAQVIEFFQGLGLPIREGLGMSEAGTITINPADDIRPGTVGRPLPGYELRLAADGELLVRGPGVMRGYRDDPQRTAEALAGGWLHTGDIAEIDADGYVRIVDRKKELIINASGKNMSPVAIETVLKDSSPLIGQACVIGDARPYNVALLVLDPDAAAAWSKEHDASGAIGRHPALVAAVEDAVRAANARLSRVEQIKRFTILDREWTADSPQLTPTMKLKRRGIAEVHAAEIDRLYDAEAARGRESLAVAGP